MKKLLLALVRTPNVGWKTIQRLIEKGIQEEVFHWSTKQWQDTYPFLSEEQCISLNNTVKKETINEIEEQLQHKKIAYISCFDEAYPDLLKEIYDPPWILFLKGRVELLKHPMLAFVGSRKTSSYGQKVTEMLVKDMVQKGWGTVSGMAQGIDTVSHASALRNNGLTIAVLGSGIDVIYPKHNLRLYDQICERGLVVSEYPPGTQPHPGFFPRRNRIISGLTFGTVVIEAKSKSGSLITAQLAQDQGREVFAVPGSVFDSQSMGTNLLIQRHGAKLITQSEDILVELDHLQLEDHFSAATTTLDSDVQQTNKHMSSKAELQEKRLNDGRMVDDIEKKILHILNEEKKHINEIVQQANAPFANVTKALLTLELKQRVQPLPGSYYQRIDVREDSLDEN